MSGGEREKKRRADGGAPAALLLGGRELPTDLLYHALSYLNAWRLYGLLGVSKPMRDLIPEVPRRSSLVWRFHIGDIPPRVNIYAPLPAYEEEEEEDEDDDDEESNSDASDRKEEKGVISEASAEDKVITRFRSWTRLPQSMSGPFSKIDTSEGMDQLTTLLAEASLPKLHVLQTKGALLGVPRASNLLALRADGGILTPIEKSLSAKLASVARAYPSLRELRLPVARNAMPSLAPLSTTPLRYLDLLNDKYWTPTKQLAEADIPIAEESEVKEKKAELPHLRILHAPHEWLPLIEAPRLTHLYLPSTLGLYWDHPQSYPQSGFARSHLGRLHQSHPLLQCLLVKHRNGYGENFVVADNLPSNVAMKRLRHIDIECEKLPSFLLTSDFPALETVRVSVSGTAGVTGPDLDRFIRRARGARLLEVLWTARDLRYQYSHAAFTVQPGEEAILVDWEELCIQSCPTLASAILSRVIFSNPGAKLVVYGQMCCRGTPGDNTPLFRMRTQDGHQRPISISVLGPGADRPSGAEQAWEEAVAESKRAAVG